MLSANVKLTHGHADGRNICKFSQVKPNLADVTNSNGWLEIKDENFKTEFKIG